MKTLNIYTSDTKNQKGTGISLLFLVFAFIKLLITVLYRFHNQTITKQYSPNNPAITLSHRSFRSTDNYRINYIAFGFYKFIPQHAARQPPWTNVLPQKTRLIRDLRKTLTIKMKLKIKENK